MQSIQHCTCNIDRDVDDFNPDSARASRSVVSHLHFVLIPQIPVQGHALLGQALMISATQPLPKLSSGMSPRTKAMQWLQSMLASSHFISPSYASAVPPPHFGANDPAKFPVVLWSTLSS